MLQALANPARRPASLTVNDYSHDFPLLAVEVDEEQAHQTLELMQEAGILSDG